MTVDRDAREELRALAERQLSAEEFRAMADAPMAAEEREEILALVAWFCRRYPTPAERLAYVRRTYRRWQLNQPRS